MAITFILLSPKEVPNYGDARPFLAQTLIYYLGYRRNAWNGTTINRYNPGHFSLDVGKLQSLAEEKRKQGSKFKIESIPALVINYITCAYVIAPINEDSDHYYNDLLKHLQHKPAWRALKGLPDPDDHSLLIFKASDAINLLLHCTTTAPVARRLNSSGGDRRYLLHWHSAEPAKYAASERFLNKLQIAVARYQEDIVDRPWDDELSEAEWQAINPIIKIADPTLTSDARAIVNGIRWKFNNNIPWPDVPLRYTANHDLQNIYSQLWKNGVWHQLIFIVATTQPDIQLLDAWQKLVPSRAISSVDAVKRQGIVSWTRVHFT